MEKILLIEDDQTISMSITYLLSQEGYNVISCFSIKAANNNLETDVFSLVLLDLSLPDGNGLDLCTEIKNRYHLPVIIITAKDEEQDLVNGFEIGADDYITKPFRSKELVSRIKNIIKLYNPSNNNNDNLRYLDIMINKKEFSVYKNNQKLDLTALEYKILFILFQNKHQVLTRDQILSSIWDVNDEYVNDNTLTVYIKRIREKIEDNPNDPKIIKTVRSVGYKVGE